MINDKTNKTDKTDKTDKSDNTGRRLAQLAGIGAGVGVGKYMSQSNNENQNASINLNGQSRWGPQPKVNVPTSDAEVSTIHKTYGPKRDFIGPPETVSREELAYDQAFANNLPIKIPPIDSLTGDSSALKIFGDINDNSTITYNANLKIEKLEENFLKKLDRNILRPGQYQAYKEQLQSQHSQSKQLQAQLADQQKAYGRFKNSPDGPEMGRQIQNTTQALDNTTSQVRHLQDHGLKALKYTPQEMQVRNAKMSGLKTGALAGAGATAGMGGFLIANESESIEENLGRSIGNAALSAGLIGAGAIVGHAGEDAVSDAVDDGSKAIINYSENIVDQKMQNGETLSPAEQSNYDRRSDPINAGVNYLTKEYIGNTNGSNMSKYAPAAGALTGALIAQRLNKLNPSRQ